MMVAIAKVKNASPNTGSYCRSGRNDGWLRPTRAFGVAAVCRISLLVLAFVGLGFATSPAEAAIAVDTVTSIAVPHPVAPNPVTFSHTVSGSNRLLLVSVASRPNDAADGIVEVVTGITYGGQPLLFVGAEVYAFDDARIEIWRLVNPPTGANTVAITFNDPFNTVDEAAVAGAVSFTGVDQTTPLGTFVSARTSCPTCSEVPSVTVASAPGELVFDTVARKRNPVTVDPSQAEQWNRCSDAGCSDVGGGASTEPGAASVTMSWTPANNRWAIGAVPIKPAAGGLLAEYWVDEAASGQAPTSLVDNAATPLNMPLTYVGPSPVWADGTGGNRHLRFTGTDGTDTGGALVDVNTTKIDAIHGAQKATLVAKYAMDSNVCTTNGDRIFGISDGDGSADAWFAMRERLGRDTLMVRWAGIGTYGAYALGNGTPSCPIDSAATVHWVVDTTQGVAADRVRAYIDGVAATVQVTNGALPPLNATIDLGPGTRRMFLGRAHTGIRTFRGRVWYAALYDSALSAAAVASDATAINACDDLSGCANLEIIKRAFLADGTPIPTGATIPNFLVFKFLLYINNQDIAVSDVTVRDVLDPAFQYQLETIQVDNSVAECALTVCTAAEELAIFTAVNGAAFMTDAADGDVASYTGASSSVDAGDSTVANLQLDINADAVWAILFSAKMP